VLIGATPESRKDWSAFTDGAAESGAGRRDLLLDLKRRGLDVPPRLVHWPTARSVLEGAGEVWPKTREQRCWVHKIANVLAQLPRASSRKLSNARCRKIWMAETQGRRRTGVRPPHRELHAEIREGGRLPAQGSRHAAGPLRLPGRALEQPAHHNPIESTFATVRHRHDPIEGLPIQQDRRGLARWSSNWSGHAEKLAPSRRHQPVAKTSLWV